MTEKNHKTSKGKFALTILAITIIPGALVAYVGLSLFNKFYKEVKKEEEDSK